MGKPDDTCSNGTESNMTGFNPSYIGQRDSILSLLPDTAHKVLDIGCSVGTLGEQIKKLRNSIVVGIESDEQMAAIAQKKLDSVVIGDVEKICLDDYLTKSYFDCVILADVLEHLRNPWDVLKDITPFLHNEGVIVASIPNVRHYTTIMTLAFRGYWPYRDRGIHDRTHLRFFTLRNINEMFTGVDMKIVRIERTYRIIETEPEGVFKYLSYLNRFSKYSSIPFLKNFLTFQYLVIAKKN